MTKERRQQMIDACVADRMRWAEGDPKYLANVFEEGYIGFAQMSNKELQSEYREVVRERKLDQ